MRQPPVKVGDRLEDFMSNTYGLATVTRVVRVDDDPHHGYLYEAIYENGYETSGTLWPDGVISGYQIDERRDRSLMPLEYVYKVGKDFDWSKYREDVSAQKKIANVRFWKNHVSLLLGKRSFKKA